MEHSALRDDLERELQESRRRIDEQGLVLYMRSQQLLNYTHEHVERSRVESERRLEEQIKNGILSSHNRIQEDRNTGEMKTHQSAQWQHAVELVEERCRADVRQENDEAVMEPFSRKMDMLTNG
ncbi:hypothetical protein PC120_g9718 [Phytophthora cactorum]|nr:hypothetical protein PC120_g9718 [Phytophthora cactorum]